MNLQNWKTMARQHWKEHLPEKYRQLKEAGTLEAALDQAVEQTYRETEQLEASGFSPDEAWQMTREQYLLPPADPQKAAPSLTQQAMDAVRNGQRTMPAR